MKYTLADYKSDSFRNSLIKSINSIEDLKERWWNHKFHGIPVLERRRHKMSGPYKNIDRLEGHGLELGFAMGTSVAVLLERYPNITLDLLDFNDDLRKIGLILQKYSPRIKQLYWGNSARMDFSDSKYDFVNSQSFFEHLTEDVYWDTLSEIKRVVKPNGFLFVYVDQTGGPGNPEHIRVRGHKKIRNEIGSYGFEPVSDFVFINRKDK